MHALCNKGNVQQLLATPRLMFALKSAIRTSGWLTADVQSLHNLTGELAKLIKRVNQSTATKLLHADVIDEGVVDAMNAEHVDEDLFVQKLGLDVAQHSAVALADRVLVIVGISVGEENN